MGHFVRKHGFVSWPALIADVVTEMSNNGFNLVFTGVDKYTLEATATVDPLAATQPWRIHFDAAYFEYKYLPPISTDQVVNVDNEFVKIVDVPEDVSGRLRCQTKRVTDYGKIYVGTPIQLPDDGSVASYSPTIRMYDKYLRKVTEIFPGQLYTQIPTTAYNFDQTSEISHPSDDFVPGNIDTIFNSIDMNPCNPCTYTLAISDHGFVLSVVSESKALGTGNFWMNCQRLVDSKTGEIFTTGHSPVVCLYHIDVLDTETTTFVLGDNNVFIPDCLSFNLARYDNTNMIIIRESDVYAPNLPVPVNQSNQYINGIWNANKQLSISKTDEYIVNFPDGITTDRHFYPNMRIDMVGFISAQVIAESSVFPITLHEEPTQRTYIAQRSNVGYMEGSRMVMQKSGQGID